jgi:DNA repair protein RadD
VLILCPNGTLVDQNAKKVRAIGEPVSIFSASLGSKSLRHKIVVGTPQSIKNSLSRFDDRFAAILIDEGEGLTNAVIAIYERIKDMNPNARTIGFTGTPFRTGTGYVYRIGLDGNPMPEDQCKSPFYAKLIHQTTTHDLMDEGYLTPMIVGDIGADVYETSNLVANRNGKFSKSAVDEAYHGHGRKTSGIVADIVARSAGRNGVMIFGGTVQHCQEIMASLPPDLSRMVSSKQSKEENTSNIADFKAQRFKYLVNKDMLTVGADFPHVDVIALLRKTESARLMQQILGRGIRLSDGVWDVEPETAELRKQAIANSVKPCCMLLDYTEDNEAMHYPDGDLFNPVVQANVSDKERTSVTCNCPMCDGQNEFSGRPNPDGYEYSSDGYFIDLAGQKIETEHGPIPAHFGRRCLNLVPVGGGRLDQCQYRWTSKECPHCAEPNDIAAKYCTSCKGEIIDPNEKLALEFKRLKRNPREMQCDEVIGWEVRDTVSRNGNEMKRYDITVERRSFSVWIMQEPTNNLAASAKALFDTLGGDKPNTVTYKKDDAGFFKVFAFNKPKDEDGIG